MQRAAPATPPARPPLAPRPQSSAGQPPVAYGTRPQYSTPKHSPPPPGSGQRQNYSSPGAMPQGGIPIPRAAPVAASAASMPGSPPLPASPYPYQTLPRIPVERGIPGAGRRGLIRIVTTLVIIVVCFFIGSGIYYFFNRTGTPSQPNSIVDVTPPSIQVSTTSTTETGATITWITDERATSQVQYGKTETYGSSTTPDTNLSTSHSVKLTGLDPNTTYHFKVISKDAAGNEATAKGELTTLATADTTPPTISGVNISNITESSATITWITDERATSQVQYGKTETYGSSTTPDTSLTPTHTVTLTGLDDGTTYNFQVISKDSSGNIATSANQTFETPAAIPVGAQKGNRAPDFTLEDINGNEWKLSDLRGKIVMVNFWGIFCTPCKEELPFFQAISDNETAGGFKILAINVGEGTNTVRSFVNGEGYTFTVLLDSKKEVNTLYDVSYYPTTFFINADGIIKERKEGRFQSQTEIETILDSL
jgi:peroxiredoxin